MDILLYYLSELKNLANSNKITFSLKSFNFLLRYNVHVKII